jgi:hypothetical protein
MRGKRETRPKWPAIYTFLGRGKRWQPSNNIGCLANNIGCLANNIGCLANNIGEQYRLFSGRTISVIYFKSNPSSTC